MPIVIEQLHEPVALSKSARINVECAPKNQAQLIQDQAVVGQFIEQSELNLALPTTV